MKHSSGGGELVRKIGIEVGEGEGGGRGEIFRNFVVKDTVDQEANLNLTLTLTLTASTNTDPNANTSPNNINPNHHSDSNLIFPSSIRPMSVCVITLGQLGL